MRRRAWLGSLAVLCCLWMAPARADKKPPNKDALALQKALQEAIARAEPSVACILVSRSDKYREFGQAPSADKPGELGGFAVDYSQPGMKYRTDARRQLALKLDLKNTDNVPESFGSGVVIDETDRLVLTNYHVVRDATKVYVRLPGGEGSYANIHAADPRSDLAVLQLIDDNVTVKALPLGNADKVRKGQMVLTIANPYAAGFKDGSPSASWGIISNVRRRAPGKARSEIDQAKLTLHHYGTLLQTDTRLNLGCSGGALVDLSGELIGLTTALAAISGSETPGGFAVPFDAGMRRVIQKLKKGEEAEYGFLGVGFDDDLAVHQVRIGLVSGGSPAFAYGLRTGDVIRSVNGTPVQRVDDVFLPLSRLPPKAEVALKITRRENGVLRDLTIKPVLAKFCVQGKIIARNRREFRGLRADYSSLAVQQPWKDRLGDRRDVPRGVLLVEVRASSPAADAGLRAGDVITRVNGQPVADPDQFYRAVKGLTGEVGLTRENGSSVKVKEHALRHLQ